MSADSEVVMNIEEAGGLLRETLDIEGRLERNPYGMVAGALGIGFVLGGGLFTRLTARILGAGLRVGLMAALPILQETFAQAVTGSKDTNKKEVTNETARHQEHGQERPAGPSGPRGQALR